MNDRMDVVIQQLREEEANLQAQCGELRQRLKEIEENAKRIQSALVALGAKPAAKASRKRPAGNAPNKDQIAAIAAEILKSNEALDTDRLRAEVERRLRIKGLSRMSFNARFHEALTDERFVESPAGWKLIQEHDAMNAAAEQAHHIA